MKQQREQALLLMTKAAEDETLLDEIIGSGRVSDAVFGFHCQQAAEKLLKAMLSAYGLTFPRTHNLKLLMDLLHDAGHPLPEDLSELDTLTPYGTLFRYEYIPAKTALERASSREMIRRLRAHLEAIFSKPH